ncbi:hypothetical protein PV04_09362 [Phialophora macrospora]|uniref:Uncharacterized protein n=1 Tax=Phialophora macrospora TaxID=1851006 RepID=A0A0D2FWV1_9EURO|nr:hypothetical protein PV04_09362 [Phialophora macrospora]
MPTFAENWELRTGIWGYRPGKEGPSSRRRAEGGGQSESQRPQRYLSTRMHGLGSATEFKHASRTYQGHSVTIPSKFKTYCVRAKRRAATPQNRTDHNGPDETR